MGVSRVLDIQIPQILLSLRKSISQYVNHKNLQVRPTQDDRFQTDKKMEVAIEREVILPIRKKNHEVWYSLCVIDNIYGYLTNLDWGLELALYDVVDDKQELSLYLLYTPRDDRIMYYVGNGEWYLSVGNKIDAVAYPKFPSALGSYLGIYSESKNLIRILMDSHESKRIHDFITTGSIVTDVMNLLCGKTCCMFSILHSEKEEILRKLLIESGFTVYSINEVCITYNNNAVEISEEEE